MARVSAGLLMYRRRAHGLEVFLVHPGGPFFAGKDDGAWTVPKGVAEIGEALPSVALREFQEETGQSVEDCAGSGSLLELGSVRQAGGKEVYAWAFKGEWEDGAPLRSNTFSMEWPPRSGKKREFPEVDRGEFFALSAARQKINPAQTTFLDRLQQALGEERSTST